MSVAREIPLVPVPSKFRITLSGRFLSMRTQYRDEEEAGWVLDIGDATTGEPLINGIPLVTGQDLLAQYKYVGITGELMLTSDEDYDSPPFEELGVTSHLFHVTDT